MDDRRNTILFWQKVLLLVNILGVVLLYLRGAYFYYNFPWAVWILVIILGFIDLLNVFAVRDYTEYEDWVDVEPLDPTPSPKPAPSPRPPVPKPNPKDEPKPKQIVVIYKRTHNSSVTQCKHCDYLNKSYSTKCDLCGSILV